MKIEANYEKRQLVSIGRQLYRRLGLRNCATWENGAAPIWQEQIHTGEFHNIITSRCGLTSPEALEALYLALPISAPTPENQGFIFRPAV